MSLHSYESNCDWHPPTTEESGTGRREDGFVCEWQATCSCGWVGNWRGGSTHVAADRAKQEYREHVEEALGAAAYYAAPVACKNCGSEHEQGVLVGTAVYQAACVRCGNSMLDPRNDAWDDAGRRSRGLWL